MEPVQPVLLPVPEVARLLGVSIPMVWVLVSDKRIKSVKIGTRRLVTQAALNAYIAGLESVADAELVAAGE